MRLFLTAVLLLLLTLAVGVLLSLQSPARLQRAAEWAVQTFTSQTLELKGFQRDQASQRFIAREIHLYPGDREQAPLVSITGLSARLDLIDLLLGSMNDAELQADSVTIFVRGEPEEDTSPAPTDWIRQLRWLPASLEIGTVHIVSALDGVRVVPLRDVSGHRVDRGSYRLNAAGDLDGEPLEVTLYLYALRSDRGLRGVQLRGEFYATRSARLAIVEGEVRGGAEKFGYDLFLHAAAPDLNTVLSRFEHSPSLSGTLQISGRMHGDAEGFELSDAEFHLQNVPEYEFSAKGSFSYHGDDDTMVDLQAEGQMARLDDLIDWISLDLSSLGAARARLALHGPVGKVGIDDFTLSTEHSEGLRLDVSGSLPPGTLSGDPASGERHLRVNLQGPKLAVLRQWLGEPEYDPGPWRLSGVVRGGQQALQLEQLQLELGSANTLSLAASGAIERIDLGAPLTAASVTGVDLQVTAQAPDLAQLNQWLDTALPLEHQVQVRTRITGNGARLLLSEGSGSVSGSDIELQLSELQGELVAGEEWRSEGFQGDVSLRLSDLSALSRYVDTTVPMLGSLDASARLIQVDQSLALRDIRAGVDSEALKLQASGEIGDALELEGVDLKVAFSNLDSRKVLSALREDFQYDQPLGQLAGTLRVEHSGKHWDLTGIDIDNGENAGFSLRARGELRDIGATPRADLTLMLGSSDRALLKAVTGLSLPRFKASLRSRSLPGAVKFSGDGALGQTKWELQGDLQYADDQLNGLHLRLDSPHLYLRDLGLEDTSEQGAPPKGQTRQAAQDAPSPGRLESLIASLPDYPVTLDLHLGGISGENIIIRRLDLEATGEERRYLLRTFNVDFAQAVAEIRGLVDLQAQPPAISLAGLALGVDMTHLLNDLSIDSDIEGVLNVRGGLSARGVNNDEWLRSLEGNLAVALEDGVIQGAAYDMLATDFLAWILSGAALLEDSTYVQCTMARFDIKSGIASTDSLFIESPRMVATGKGQLNLVKQTMDITFTPRSKQRLLQIPSSVTLRGPMENPTTWVSPITATADTYAQALLLVPSLTLKLFGIDTYKTRTLRPCQVSPSR